MLRLDHRLKLFGEFYDPQDRLSFVYGVQEKYCRFIYDHDGTGLLDNPDAKVRPSLRSMWPSHRHLRSGSRVFCEWRAVCTPNTAPALWKSILVRPILLFSPISSMMREWRMALPQQWDLRGGCIDIYRRTRANDVHELMRKYPSLIFSVIVRYACSVGSSVWTRLKPIIGLLRPQPFQP